MRYCTTTKLGPFTQCAESKLLLSSWQKKVNVYQYSAQFSGFLGSEGEGYYTLHLGWEVHDQFVSDFLVVQWTGDGPLIGQWCHAFYVIGDGQVGSNWSRGYVNTYWYYAHTWNSSTQITPGQYLIVIFYWWSRSLESCKLSWITSWNQWIPFSQKAGKGT